MRLGLLLLLSACSSIDPSTLTIVGAATEGAYADKMGPATEADATSGATISTTSNDPADPFLMAWEQGGLVTVDESGVVGSCDAVWSVRPSVFGHKVLFDFVDENSRVLADDCLWDFLFTIEGLPPGNWEIGAKSQRADVTVP